MEHEMPQWIATANIWIMTSPTLKLFRRVGWTLGNLTVVFGLLSWLLESTDRVAARQFQAWTVINLASGKSGEGGKTRAFSNLIGDGVGLEGLNFSEAQFGSNNEMFDWRGVSFYGSHFINSSFENLDMTPRFRALYIFGFIPVWFTRVRSSIISTTIGGDFGGIELRSGLVWMTHFLGAVQGTNLSYSNIRDATFSFVTRSNFSYARVDEVLFKKLIAVDFTDAHLRSVRIENFLGQSTFKGANLEAVTIVRFDTGLSESDVVTALSSAASLCEVRLPSGKQLGGDCLIKGLAEDVPADPSH